LVSLFLSLPVSVKSSFRSKFNEIISLDVFFGDNCTQSEVLSSLTILPNQLIALVGRIFMFAFFCVASK